MYEPLTVVTYVAIIVYAQGFAINTATTLYLHRAMTHAAVQFHWLVQFPMRFAVWFWNGILVLGWTGVHAVHHANTDQPGDPHSAHVHGVYCAPDTPEHQPGSLGERLLARWLNICPHGLGIVFKNYVYYRRATKRPDVADHGRAPNDWLERYWFSCCPWLGPLVLLPLSQVGLAGLIFGFRWAIPIGLTTWGLLLLWTVLSGGIVNGLGHSAREPNPETRDFSRNLPRWLNLILVGEQNHFDHHRFPGRWWFGKHDLGALIIRLLVKLNLAQVKLMPA